MQKLDVDIIYAVLGHARIDRQLLKTCSLVCKAWEPVSRSNLFRSIKVNDWGTLLSGFENFLNRSPHVAVYILELDLAGCSTVKEITPGSGLRDVWSSVSVQFMAALLSKLPMLRSLRLHLIKLYGTAPTHTSFHALQRFHCDDVPSQYLCSRTFPALLSLIALFTSIDHLILEGDCAATEWDDDKTEQILKLPGPVEIHAMQLCDLSPQVLAAVLHAIAEDAALQRFDMLAGNIRHLDTIAILGSFLAVRDSIQHLRLDLSRLHHSSGEDPVAWNALCLSECSSLTSLDLSLAGSGSGRITVADTALRLRACVYMLTGQGTPPGLRRITLHLEAKHDNHSVFSLEWGDLDRTLCLIPSLASFVIDICPRWGSALHGERKFSNILPPSLPRVREKGMLKIREHDVGDLRSVLRATPS